LKYLVDTNVLSESSRRRPDAGVVAWFATVPADHLFLSVLTLGEIAKGIGRLRRRDPVSAEHLGLWIEFARRRFADRILPVDDRIAETWGRLNIVRDLPAIDGLLAATALVHGLRLVTRNVKDFVGLGVRVFDPWTRRS